jgi:ABC-type antimicrobial peptide transport system permease subunit
VGLSSQITRIVISIGVAFIDRSLFQRLTWLVVVLAAVGVFATLLMQARERVHDLGIHKALGMTPRQVIAMVICWAVTPALLAAAIALPAGIVLEPVVARAIVSAEAGPAETINPLLPGPLRGAGQAPRPGKAVINAPTPHQQLRSGRQPGGPAPGAPGLFAPLISMAGQNPYTPGELALLALAGLAIALAGAVGPAIWAAASRATIALRAE